MRPIEGERHCVPTAAAYGSILLACLVNLSLRLPLAAAATVINLLLSSLSTRYPILLLYAWRRRAFSVGYSKTKIKEQVENDLTTSLTLLPSSTFTISSPAYAKPRTTCQQIASLTCGNSFVLRVFLSSDHF